jgi:hypothetical protein
LSLHSVSNKLVMHPLFSSVVDIYLCGTESVCNTVLRLFETALALVFLHVSEAEKTMRCVVIQESTPMGR